MEVLDYEELEEEFDRVLEEADPCENCQSKDDLAVGVVTSKEQFGTILVVCAACHIDEEYGIEGGVDQTQQVLA